MQRHITDEKLQLDVVDGLRGIAALIVVFSHTSNAGMYFLPYLNGKGVGKSGVFLFFLISAFLLSRALIKKGNEAFSLPSLGYYTQRRVFRIYPLYVPYLAFIVLSTYFAQSIYHLDNVGVPYALTLYDLLSHLLLIQGKGVTWSIAVEFKFYLLLPFIIFVITILQKNYSTIFVICFLVLLIVLTQIVSPQHVTPVNDISLLPYLCIFLIGVLLAVIQSEIELGKNNENYTQWLPVLGTLSACLLVVMIPSVARQFEYNLPYNFFHNYFIEHAVLWGFVLMFVVNHQGGVARLLKSRILVFYGNLCFSIYLIHPLFIFLAKKMYLGSFGAAWFVLASSTAASYVLFKFIELPMSKYTIQK